MREDYPKFTDLGAEVLVMGPDGPNAFKRYWTENDMPFPGMADIRSKVAAGYHQEVNWFKLGRMPSILLIDRQGRIVYRHDGSSMADYPGNAELLEVLKTIT